MLEQFIETGGTEKHTNYQNENLALTLTKLSCYKTTIVLLRKHYNDNNNNNIKKNYFALISVML